MKTVVVTGATGFVGKRLTLELLKRGYLVRVHTRDEKRARDGLRLPVTFHEKLTPELFEGASAVFHLAGENVAGSRWSPQAKKKILESRTKATDEIIRTIRQTKTPPTTFISASAIGIYGDRGDKILSEESSYGQDFLAEVCRGWELSGAAFSGRKVFLRTGIVLGHGGALEKMLLPFRLGAGGKLASGKQWMSWIHVDDLVSMYVYALENERMSGAYNAVAPQPVTNQAFTKTLADVLGRPALFPVPAIALKLLFGEMSTVLLGSQRVSSRKIQSEGFSFRFSGLTDALTDILRPLNLNGAYVFEDVHWLPESPEKVFPFFSEAKNLETITPPWLNFHIQKTSTPEIAKGTLIDYKLRIKGVPAHWKTLISRWEQGRAFVDEQLKGPYKTWHHTHEFLPLNGGTLMQDRVIYRMPFGPLGDVVRKIMVESDIRKIFNYRSQIIGTIFPWKK